MSEPSDESRDIFDMIMSLPIFRIFLPFYNKYKEGLLYLFFGFLSFLVSFITYFVFTEILNIDSLIANVFAWIFSVTFAYVTNRVWVFKAASERSSEIIKEICRFFSGRIASLVVEELILFVFIKLAGLESIPVKLAGSVVVIIMNYIISKFWVFGSGIRKKIKRDNDKASNIMNVKK